MFKKKSVILPLIIILFLINGCILKSKINNPNQDFYCNIPIHLDFTRNITAQPRINEILYEILYQSLQSDNNLKLTDVNNAEYLIKSEIVDYNKTIAFKDVNDVAHSYNLSARLKLTIIKNQNAQNKQRLEVDANTNDIYIIEESAEALYSDTFNENAETELQAYTRISRILTLKTMRKIREYIIKKQLQKNT